MSLLNEVCDLDYQVLKCFFENLHFLHFNIPELEKQLRWLKILHRQVGYLKSELLEQHPEYIDVEQIQHSIEILKEFLSEVEAFFKNL
jgi:hypothetical protein